MADTSVTLGEYAPPHNFGGNGGGIKSLPHTNSTPNIQTNGTTQGLPHNNSTGTLNLNGLMDALPLVDNAPVEKFQVDQQVALQHDKLISALIITDNYEYETMTEEITKVFGKKSPVSALMEMAQYLRTKVNFVEVGQPEGPDHKPRFTMVAVVDGKPFTRVRAGNKKDCRTGAAYLAWKSLLQESQHKFLNLLADDSLPKYPKMAALSHLEYLKQVERNPQVFCGRRVLAAIIMKRKQKKGRKDVMKVVSVGMGNRVILSSHLSMEGGTVNDSHAEVIARRAFLRFLYNELHAYKSGSRESIFETSQLTGKAKVKSSITFHLYISTAPCGDSSLFSRNELEESLKESNKEKQVEKPNPNEPIFASSSQGLLRTKIEAGEGSIPVEKNYIQTWIGLQFGNRLRTMSCSDKICRWNLLGLQGALLTHFMDPVYLSSVVIGENFMYGHIARALFYRLTKGEKELKVPMPPGYMAVCPDIGQAKVEIEVQDTEKSTALTVMWSQGDDKAEVMDGTTGKIIDNGGANKDNTPFPSVCKRRMYDEFLNLCDRYNRPDLKEAENYYFAKLSAKEYQEAKEILYNVLEENGYGRWVKKPLELDYFE